MIDSLIKEKEIENAHQLLKKLTENYYNDFAKKKSLLETESSSTVFLQVALKKIPKTKLIKKIKVTLPHSLARDNTEVCLITGDLDKRNHKAEVEPDILHYKELLDKHGVTQISEIVTLRQLRTEYKPYEAKQKLLAAYDIFLADNKITECLPRVLGKHFFKKRKFPVQINLKTKNLKQQIDKALSIKECYFTGRGDSCTVEVAYLDMDGNEIAANVLTMVKILSEQLPGQVENIKAIYLKTARSKSIPLYLSYESGVQIKDEIIQNAVEYDDLPTIPNRMVKVFSDGTVKAINVRDDKIEAIKIKVEKKKSKIQIKEDIIQNDVKDEKIEAIKIKVEEEYDVLFGQSDEEKKQSKKVKRKSKAGLFDSSNDITDKKGPAELNEFTGAYDESSKEKKQSKKAKRKSKAGLFDSSNDITDKKGPAELNEFTGAYDESNKEKKQPKKAKRKSKVDLSGSSNDMSDKDDSVEFNEFAGLLDESNKEEKQSKKARRKSRVELPGSSYDVTGKENPVEFHEYSEAQSIVESPERKKKLKKNEKKSESLCDNSKSSETTVLQVKKDVSNKNASVEKSSKTKHLAIKETSLEESHRETKKLRKRKRSEPVLSSNEMNDEDNKTPVQIKKRAKLENVNKIQTIALKEALQVGRKKRESRPRRAKL